MRRNGRAAVRTIVVAGAAVLLLVLPAGAAGAVSGLAAPLTGATTLARGLPSCPVSPGFNDEYVGTEAAMDDGKYLFFSDQCNNGYYRRPDGKGASAGARHVTLDSKVLATFKLGSRYYLTKFGDGANDGIYQFDPTTLALKSSAPIVAIPDIRDAAIDPQSHDVFVTSDAQIIRVQGLTTGKPSQSVFGPAGNLYDAIAFSPDGSLVYSTDRYGYPNIHIVGFDRNGANVSDVVAPNQGEGLAVARSGTVFVNNNGTDGSSAATYGSVSTLAPGAATLTTVATLGSRGSFAEVDCKGYLLLELTDSIVRLKPALFAPNAGAGSCKSYVKTKKKKKK